MAKPQEFHQDFSKLPESAARAKHLGEVFYFTGKRCTKNHLSTRYASSGNCVQCIADKREKLEIVSKNRFDQASKENMERAKAAMENGFSFYEPTNPCPKGHYKKFTSTHNCALCSEAQMQKRKDSARWARIRKEYGLSESQVNAMLEQQKSNCLICDVSIKSGCHIDHCHSTGVVRGILCSRCNQAIGLLDEDQQRMQKAANYLKRFST